MGVAPPLHECNLTHLTVKMVNKAHQDDDDKDRKWTCYKRNCYRCRPVNGIVWGWWRNGFLGDENNEHKITCVMYVLHFGTLRT